MSKAIVEISIVFTGQRFCLFNRFIVHFDPGVVAYELEAIA